MGLDSSNNFKTKGKKMAKKEELRFEAKCGTCNTTMHSIGRDDEGSEILHCKGCGQVVHVYEVDE